MSPRNSDFKNLLSSKKENTFDRKENMSQKASIQKSSVDDAYK